MLSVQSPSPLDMSPTSQHYLNNNWSSWRSAAGHSSDLPTPPSSVPSRRTKSFNHHLSAQAHDEQHHLTLPPITHLDQSGAWTSPLTPPDDEMYTSPQWRDSKPGPSRLHSPVTAHASPLLNSPSPSPIDEDDEQYDSMEEQKEGYTRPESEWEWQQQQREVQQQTDSYQAYPEPPSHLADWVTSTQKRSAHFIAEKTCEMVCYLWFSSSLGPGAAASRHRRERERARRAANGHSSPPFAPLSNDRTANLQFNASPEFVAFMQKLLETTQVSQSVIVLSLHYIFRLKERNDFTIGKPGSEFRVAVCALMLANKFVDDNTYTNKTWSEVSGISLAELNKMEREFLLGVDFRLFIDESTYESWLNLLRGLVLAKEREHQRWRSRRQMPGLILPAASRPFAHASIYAEGQFERADAQGERKGRNSQPDTSAYRGQPISRARSTSPRHLRYANPSYPFTFAVPHGTSSSSVQTLAPLQVQSAHTSPSDSTGLRSKRTAADAFSPTSASFGSMPPAHPTKRPTGLAVDIDAALASASRSRQHLNVASRGESVSANPTSAPFAESLKGLERLSITCSHTTPITPVDNDVPPSYAEVQQQQQREQPHTLAASYDPEDAPRHALPQNLYFYTLASSPVRRGPVSTETEVEDQEEGDDDERIVYPSGAERKARLKYSRAPIQTSEGYGTVHTHGVGYAQPAYSCAHQEQPGAFRSASSAYTQPSAQVPPPYSVHPLSQASTYRSSQRHLPPLALALQQFAPPRATPPLVAHSARSSPLPSFADAYGAVPLPDQTMASAYTPGVAAVSARAQSGVAAPTSWSAPASESADAVYVHPSSHAHHPHHHAYKPSVPSPLALAAHRAHLAHQHAHASPAKMPAKLAAFANAGPPGVVHFYQPQTPYRASGFMAGASSPAQSQSQSVSASPYAYAFAARGRRY